MNEISGLGAINKIRDWMRDSFRRPLILAGIMGLPLIMAGSGCRTFNESGEFASVVIQNHTQEEIAQTTAKVFGDDGYVGRIGGPGEMIFEKDASRGASLAREGLASGYYGAQTIVRVKVSLVPLSTGGF